MRYGRKGKSRAGNGDGSFWICFSDLMSALMLVFVLVMFYSVYQYFDMLEVKTAELLRQSGLLDQQQSQLTLSQQELADKEAQLTAQQATLDEQSEKLTEQSATLNAQSEKLTAQETALLAQQAKMLLQEQTLQTLQDKLAEQEQALNSAQISLDEALLAQQGQQALLDAQQAKLDKLVGVRTEIIEELADALRQSNITGANVDDSGAIVFSSEMMFSTGSSGLNETGKQFLNSFLPNYLKVLMGETYSKNVSQIIIEGHTDTQGSYMTNVALSQERALSVLGYVMSNEFTGISPAEKQRLEQVVTINGRAYSDPIYKADGTVDMEASRRVVIKFRLNDEDMVTEMLNVLNEMN
jgi:chemotaxis protein MotB